MNTKNVTGSTQLYSFLKDQDISDQFNNSDEIYISQKNAETNDDINYKIKAKPSNPPGVWKRFLAVLGNNFSPLKKFNSIRDAKSQVNLYNKTRDGSSLEGLRQVTVDNFKKLLENKYKDKNLVEQALGSMGLLKNNKINQDKVITIELLRKCIEFCENQKNESKESSNKHSINNTNSDYSPEEKLASSTDNTIAGSNLISNISSETHQSTFSQTDNQTKLSNDRSLENYTPSNHSNQENTDGLDSDVTSKNNSDSSHQENITPSTTNTTETNTDSHVDLINRDSTSDIKINELLEEIKNKYGERVATDVYKSYLAHIPSQRSGLNLNKNISQNEIDVSWNFAGDLAQKFGYKALFKKIEEDYKNEPVVIKDINEKFATYENTDRPLTLDQEKEILNYCRELSKNKFLEDLYIKYYHQDDELKADAFNNVLNDFQKLFSNPESIITDKVRGLIENLMIFEGLEKNNEINKEAPVHETIYDYKMIMNMIDKNYIPRVAEEVRRKFPNQSNIDLNAITPFADEINSKLSGPVFQEKIKLLCDSKVSAGSKEYAKIYKNILGKHKDIFNKASALSLGEEKMVYESIDELNREYYLENLKNNAENFKNELKNLPLFQNGLDLKWFTKDFDDFYEKINNVAVDKFNDDFKSDTDKALLAIYQNWLDKYNSTDISMNSVYELNKEFFLKDIKIKVDVFKQELAKRASTDNSFDYKDALSEVDFYYQTMEELDAAVFNADFISEAQEALSLIRKKWG